MLKINKYILNNFDLEFISPVISTVDPKAIKDATTAQQYMPTEFLIFNKIRREKAEHSI